VKAIDTNILARFFINDPDDAEAVRQRPSAVAALSERTFVSVTVLLEFEWVMRGFYEFARSDVARAIRALASMEQVSIEDRGAVLVALDAFIQGLDFAEGCISREVRAPPRFSPSIGAWPNARIG
jgi:predicted nucleic-acid-binding protein